MHSLPPAFPIRNDLSLQQPALEDLVDPLARTGENTGDHPLAGDDLVFEDDPMGADPQAVESFQFIREGLDVAFFIRQILDRETERMAGLWCQTTKVFHHFILNPDRDHISSSAEIS